MKRIQPLSWIVFFLLASITLPAQTSKIDSLKSVLALSGKPDDFKVLWQLAYELFDVDNRQAVEYAKSAYESANKMGDSLQIVKSGRLYGQLLRLTHKVDEAIILMQRVLLIARRQGITYEVGKLLGALANAHVYKAEHDLALEYYFQALNLWEKDKNKERISDSFQNIGFIYYNMSNTELALEYFQQSLEMKLALNYHFDLDRLYVNMGMCHGLLLNYKVAEEFFQKALLACSPDCRNSIEAEANFGMGVNALKAKKIYLAKLYFERSLASSDLESNERFQLENLLVLSDIALNSNEIQNAQAYLARVGRIPGVDQYADLATEYYRLGSKYNEVTGNFIQANIFKQKYIDVSAKSSDARLRNKLMQIQSQFAEKQNLERIQSQARMLDLQELIIQAFGIVALVTIPWARRLYRDNKNKKRINKTLNQTVKERTVELEKKT